MREAAAARPPFDWPLALKDAGRVAGVVVLLTLALVGFRIQDTSGGPPLAYRFDDVVAVALVAFIGRMAIGALRVQRALPVLAGALVFALALSAILAFGPDEKLLPFKSTVFNWIIALAAWGLAARAAWLTWHAAGQTSAEVREARMDRLGTQVQTLAPVHLLVQMKERAGSRNVICFGWLAPRGAIFRTTGDHNRKSQRHP
jgi:hypothetical protein